MRGTGFEALLVDLGFGPGERLGVFIVGLDEGVDVLAELLDGGEGSAVQRQPTALLDRVEDPAKTVPCALGDKPSSVIK